jgi:hypothetical protein
MGSDLGGGDWRIVERLIEVAFEDYKGNVFIYDLRGTSPQLNPRPNTSEPWILSGGE